MAKKEETKDLAGFEAGINADSFQRGKNWLFLIAIKDYKHKPLNNCVNDAVALRNILQERYTFEKTEIKELYDHDASRANIHGVFRELIKNKIGKNDNFIIYYSGHGLIDDVTQAFCWVPIEAEKNNESAYVTKSEIIGFLDNIKARHIFLIVDSCFSGTMQDPLKSLADGEDELEATPSRWGLSSGRGLVSDGLPGGHSPFAQSLIDILRENTDSLSTDILGAEVIRRVKQVKKAKQKPRFERLEVDGHLGGQMVFHLRESVKAQVTPKSKVAFVQPDLLAYMPIHSDIGYPEMPFKGLRWFEKSDARNFFGRKKEIHDLFQLLDNQHDRRKRLILLYGPSGTGKSSLLFAGLLPRMPKGWKVEYKRRGQDGNAIKIMKGLEIPSSTKKSVLILDQMEEIFSNPGSDSTLESELLSSLLTLILEQNPSLSVIISFREEYLGRINNLLNYPPDTYTPVVINIWIGPGFMKH